MQRLQRSSAQDLRPGTPTSSDPSRRADHRCKLMDVLESSLSGLLLGVRNASDHEVLRSSDLHLQSIMRYMHMWRQFHLRMEAHEMADVRKVGPARLQFLDQGQRFL